MDYEKKYRDLVEAIKKLQEANPSDEGIQKWVEDNVPELKESEDEKIRKSLIGHLKECRNNTRSEVMIGEYAKWISWIEKQGEIVEYYEDKLDRCACENFNKGYKKAFEKQGEHDNFINKIQIGDKVTRNEDGVLVNLSQLNRVAKKNEKQGEQKPAWSEEDEDILNTIINHFKVDIECTDEDDTVRWLKSIKTRYTWKPSDEQIEVLEWSLHNWTGKTKEILESLQSDLKKLREG